MLRPARALPLYLALLLALAALGAANQRLLDRELALIEAREEARREIVALRAEAAAVQGPLAVARWAQERGMVPAPEVEVVEHVMPLPAPALPAPEPTGLEVRTVWR
jgi:hypothetical protein